MTAAALGLVPLGNVTSGIGPRVAHAQNFGQRNIQGKVLDDTETPVGGATVFLKNLKTRNVKSFTSIKDGSFRFAQVGMVDDYEVWAESGKKKSAVKTVSSFDSRKQVEFDLKLK
jgi:carboxypeptidase family protein